jgi:hypothetical protein
MLAPASTNLGCDTGGSVTGQQNDRGGARAHHRDRQPQRKTAAQTVADCFQHDSADWTYREAQRETAISRTRGCERIVLGKKQPRYNRRGIAEEPEIVPLEQAPDAASDERQRCQPLIWGGKSFHGASLD